MNDALQSLLNYLDLLSQRVDLEDLRDRVERLDITPDDLGAAARFCDDHYQRNLVRRTQWYEAVALCWKPGQSTPIHDHEGSSCCFRVVTGCGFEMGYRRDAAGLVESAARRDLHAGMICASQDADIHAVGNPSDSGANMITLHFYSPPMTTVNIYTEGSATVVTEELSAEPA